ncbi:MAG: hypothetical protein M3198_05955 [Actinomycetota bacterium]|nr:hypothetical protein [Actinomycetota bacterium]
MADQEQDLGTSGDIGGGDAGSGDMGTATDFPTVEDGGFDETFMPPDPVEEKESGGE